MKPKTLPQAQRLIDMLQDQLNKALEALEKEKRKSYCQDEVGV